MLIRQNQNKTAKEKLQQAIQLDPQQAHVLTGLLQFKENPTPLENAKAMLQLLQANPNDTDAAWQLAVLLDSMGLYDKALVLYGYGWQLAGRFNPETVNQGWRSTTSMACWTRARPARPSRSSCRCR